MRLLRTYKRNCRFSSPFDVLDDILIFLVDIYCFVTKIVNFLQQLLCKYNVKNDSQELNFFTVLRFELKALEMDCVMNQLWGRFGIFGTKKSIIYLHILNPDTV